MGQLRLNQEIDLKGYITSKKFVWGSISDLEAKIGYHQGRLAKGFFVAHLVRLPQPHEFELAGYSITAEHRFQLSADLDANRLKKIALEAMRRIGSRNLIKILPNTRHNAQMIDDLQYPIGRGIPQWKLIRSIPMKIFDEVIPNFKGNIILKNV